MAKRIYPNWLPKISNPVVMDAATDLRQLRGDYNGGVLAGYAGSYDVVVREIVIATATASDPDSVFTTAVPAGYLHVLQNVSCRHDNATPLVAILSLIASAAAYELASASALATQTSLSAGHELVLSAGEQLRFSVYGIASPATLRISVVGYAVRL